MYGNLDCSFNNLTSLEYCSSIQNSKHIILHCNNFENINDLDSSHVCDIISYRYSDMCYNENILDKYFKYWIDKDQNIYNVLKDRISKKCLRKYKLNIIL